MRESRLLPLPNKKQKVDSASRKRKCAFVSSKTRNLACVAGVRRERKWGFRAREKWEGRARSGGGEGEGGGGREGGKRLQGGHYEFLVKLKSQSAMLYMQNKTYSHVFTGLYWLKSNKGDLH